VIGLPGRDWRADSQKSDRLFLRAGARSNELLSRMG